MKRIDTTASPPIMPRWRMPRAVPWPVALLWLAAALVAGLLLLPPIYLIVRAVETGDATFANLLRPATLAVLGRSALLAIGVTAASALIAVPLAWLTTRTDLPLRRFWAVIAALPLVIPSYVGAYLFVSALGPRGLLQQALAPFGIERLPPIYGLPGALFALTLMTYPYMLLSVRAALSRMDPALEEAARSLGNGPWRTFWRITLPHLRPALGAGGLLVALYALRDFGAVAIMRYDTFTRVIYTQYRSFDRSQAAFYALLLIVLTVILILFEARLRGRARYDRAAVMRPLPLIKLGPWRWPALLFCASVAGLALVLPGGMLAYWLVRGLLAGEVISGLGAATRNSLFAASAAALVTVAAALPIAILVVRRPSRLSKALEQLTYSAYALPGIAVALALVFFAINLARPIYQTFPLLIVAYLLLFLPQAVGALRSALLQVHPSVEEAARSLGKGPLAVFWQITAPLIRPGMLAGAGLVFLTTMKELPATLILAPIGFQTLAISVWSAVSEAFFAQAAAPALLLICMSALPMLIDALRDRKRA